MLFIYLVLKVYLKFESANVVITANYIPLDHSIEINIRVQQIIMGMTSRRIFLLTILLVTFFRGHLFAQGKLVKQNLGDGIIMKIPDTFIPMSEKDMWQRVTSYRKSIALYTDMNRLIELGVNRSYSVWEEGDYQMMHDVYKSSILQLYDEVDFLKEGIVEIKRHPFVVFEFESKMNPDESLGSGAITKYTYIQYTQFKGQTLVFNFSCPFYQKEQWQSLVTNMMNSISLKNK